MRKICGRTERALERNGALRSFRDWQPPCLFRVSMKAESPYTKSPSASKRNASPADKKAKPPSMAEVMTPQPQTIGLDQTLDVAHRMMRENGIRHLPVLEHGELVGVLTQRDLYFLETIKGVELDEDIV